MFTLKSTVALACITAASFFSHVATATELSFDFADELPLYDISGSWDTNSGDAHLIYTVALSPQGKISGPFNSTLDDGTDYLQYTGSSAGTVTGANGQLRVNYLRRATITGVHDSEHVTGSITMHSRLLPVAPGNGLTGPAILTLCFRGHGCRSGTGTFTLPFAGEPETRGQWRLSLSFTTEKKRIKGTAVATLFNGRTVNFTISGTEGAIRKLRLAGTQEAKGTSLQVQLNAGDDLTSLRGRLFGQQLVLVR